MDRNLSPGYLNGPDGAVSVFDLIRSGPTKPLPYRFMAGNWLLHFETIMSSRAQSSWTEAEVGLAMDCAKISSLLDDQYDILLTQEDFIFVDEKGKSYPNPRYVIINRLEKRKMDLLRTLNITRYGCQTEKPAEAIKKLENERTLRGFAGPTPEASLFN